MRSAINLYKFRKNDESNMNEDDTSDEEEVRLVEQLTRAKQREQEGVRGASGLTAIAYNRLQTFRHAYDLILPSVSELTGAYDEHGEALNKLKTQFKLGEAGLRKERTQEIEREQKALVASSQAYNSLSMNLMMAGSAFMFVGRNEKTQRMGMILNAGAALVQIHRTLASASANILPPSRFSFAPSCSKPFRW